MISHFLLTLRQLTYDHDDDGLGSQPSQSGLQSGSKSASLRFASFVDNMGAELDYGFTSVNLATDLDATLGKPDLQGASDSAYLKSDAGADYNSLDAPNDSGHGNVEMALIENEASACVLNVHERQALGPPSSSSWII